MQIYPGSAVSSKTGMAHSTIPTPCTFAISCPWWSAFISVQLLNSSVAVADFRQIDSVNQPNSDAAIQQLNEAHRLAPESAEIQYNLGLTLLSLGEVDAAARHAHDAYALGYPLPGLRRKLEAAGSW